MSYSIFVELCVEAIMLVVYSLFFYYMLIHTS